MKNDIKSILTLNLENNIENLSSDMSSMASPIIPLWKQLIHPKGDEEDYNPELDTEKDNNSAQQDIPVPGLLRRFNYVPKPRKLMNLATWLCYLMKLSSLL